eukprot:TRINITY_DN8480_c3_g1_i1.p1 TRINITY_DN8480_c3_g1~~TRINITY_DN8480_c3_g1_i1.p1  ORF type:complete len:438 (-),score=74.74 TRINITY_DN8480_c3_g1_i1:326-1639(-)
MTTNSIPEQPQLQIESEDPQQPEWRHGKRCRVIDLLLLENGTILSSGCNLSIKNWSVTGQLLATFDFPTPPKYHEWSAMILSRGPTMVEVKKNQLFGCLYSLTIDDDPFDNRPHVTNHYLALFDLHTQQMIKSVVFDFADSVIRLKHRMNTLVSFTSHGNLRLWEVQPDADGNGDTIITKLTDRGWNIPGGIGLMNVVCEIGASGFLVSGTTFADNEYNIQVWDLNREKLDEKTTVASSDGTVTLKPPPRLVMKLVEDQAVWNVVAVDDRRFVTSGNKLKLWDVVTGECLWVIKKLWNEFCALAMLPPLSPSHPYVLCTGQLERWDLDKQCLLSSHKKGDFDFGLVRVLPHSGTLVVTAVATIATIRFRDSLMDCCCSVLVERLPLNDLQTALPSELYDLCLIHFYSLRMISSYQKIIHAIEPPSSPLQTDSGAQIA